MKQRSKREKGGGKAALQGLHLHLEPVSGIAGDMTVAALVDAGVPPRVVSDAVAAMGVRGLSVRFETRRRGAFMGRGFIVDEPASARRRRHEHEHEHHHDDAHEHSHADTHTRSHRKAQAHAHAHPHIEDQELHHRDYAGIRRLLARARLEPEAKALAQELFARIAEVEAALHGTPLERVAFHEIGAFDSIADIVGMSAAIAWLAPKSIGSTPAVVGTGTVRTAHGLVAVPAPATAALLRGLPMIAEGEGELTTPTGAAFLATVVDSFGPPPPLRLVSVGYGAGTRILPDRANVLRVMLGAPIGQVLPAAAEDVVVLEANIDDMTGQLLAALSDALFKAGALDVWSTAIGMKKGRPAQQISALAEPESLPAVEEAFFLNSTTLGIRRYPVSRRTLSRALEKVATPFGPVRVKVGALHGMPVGAAPEYDDCRRLALAFGVPVRQVWAVATAAAASVSVPLSTVEKGRRHAKRSRTRKAKRKVSGDQRGRR